jgi:hypothetical protein
MKYFLHDTNAFQDEKITELFMNFGYEGIGLFFTLLEKLALQEKPIKTEVLKSQLKVGKKLEKVWNFMEEIELISSNNGETFNEQLLNFSEKYQIKKEKTREKVTQWRKNQQDKKNVTSYVPICNQPKVKESKVNESNESEEENELKEKYHTYKKHLLTQTVIERLCMNAPVKINSQHSGMVILEFIETCYGDIVEKKNKFQVEQYFINWIKKENRVNEAINNQLRKSHLRNGQSTATGN